MDTDEQLSDRLRVRETIECYFFAVDTKDKTALIGCFSADAEAQYHCMTPEHKAISGGVAIGEDIYASCSRFTCSTHGIANIRVDIDGEFAEADTFAIANVVLNGHMLGRGLRYQDRLCRTPDGWRISRRKHTPIWQTAVAVAPPRLF